MTAMNYEQARFNMIEQQIRPWEVLDQQVLDLIQRVPREEFVPAAYKQQAFTDTMIPLGDNQFMMAPKIEARMLQALTIQPQDCVLEVGTGSGYVTALLASLARHVYSVEINATLSQQAAQKLAAHQINNVTFEVGDAARGWEQNKPYDVIAITGSLPILPESFQQCLNVGGRLFAVVGDSPVMDVLLITRVAENEFKHEVLFETDLPPLLNAPQPERFHL